MGPLSSILSGKASLGGNFRVNYDAKMRAFFKIEVGIEMHGEIIRTS